MSISERVQERLKEAMKARDAARTSALRMARAALLEEAKSGRGELDDVAAVAVLRRVAKQREEAAQAYEAAGRPELAAMERAEIGVIDEFLPRMADEATTLAWVREAIQATGATSTRELGKVMGHVMKAHKAEVDAGVARALAERELGS